MAPLTAKKRCDDQSTYHLTMRGSARGLRWGLRGSLAIGSVSEPLTSDNWGQTLIYRSVEFIGRSKHTRVPRHHPPQPAALAGRRCTAEQRDFLIRQQAFQAERRYVYIGRCGFTVSQNRPTLNVPQACIVSVLFALSAAQASLNPSVEINFLIRLLSSINRISEYALASTDLYADK